MNESAVEGFMKDIGLEEKFLKYPIDILLSFTTDNVTEKIIENTNLLYKYNVMYLEASAKYSFLESELNKVAGEQYDWFRTEFDRSLTKEEIIEFYLTKDAKIISAKRSLIKQQIEKDFFKMCIECVQNQAERMRDYVHHKT